MLKNTTVKHYPELTAIHRKSISFPSRFLEKNNLIEGEILDFGCGHGMDVLELRKKGFNVDQYDNFHFPHFPEKKYDVILCHYVLNVIEKEEQTRVLAEVSYLLKPGGVAYYSVRRDLAKEGLRIHAVYKKPTYQCNVVLPFESILKTKHCEIYSYQKTKDDSLLLETLNIEVYTQKGEIVFKQKGENNQKYKKAFHLIMSLISERVL